HKNQKGCLNLKQPFAVFIFFKNYFFSRTLSNFDFGAVASFLSPLSLARCVALDTLLFSSFIFNSNFKCNPKNVVAALRAATTSKLGLTQKNEM
ncbi:MAG: hypothetical protein ACK6C8_00310, partial [Pseudanabaena sp.]